MARTHHNPKTWRTLERRLNITWAYVSIMVHFFLWANNQFLLSDSSVPRPALNPVRDGLRILSATGRGAEMSNPYVGSGFDDFLAEEALLEEATAVAVKRVIAWQIEQEMAAQSLTKTAMAKKMHTSRAALNRLLDETDTSLTLTTLASAAAALGKQMRFELSKA